LKHNHFENKLHIIHTISNQALKVNSPIEKKERLFFRRKRGIIILTVVLLAVIAFFLVGDRSFFAMYRSYKEVKAKAVQIETGKRTIDSLKVECERLKSDSAYLEKIAREKLGMAREDEKVYKFLKEK